MSFIDSGINHLGKVIKTGYIQWELASKDGFFQQLDPRVKIIFLVFFIVIVSLKKTIMPELFIALFVFILTALSRLNLLRFYSRVLFLSFVFGFLISFPSAFNIITKGEIILPVISFEKAHNLWIYHIPQTIGITKEGLSVAGMLTARVINSVSISLLVLYTTSFPDIVKALKVFRAPDPILMIITLTYKYIFIFAKTVEDMHLAKKSRLLGKSSDMAARQWAAGRIALIFRKSRQRADETFKAMLSRGFSGDIRLTGFRTLAKKDRLAGIFLLLAGVIFLCI